MKLNDIIDRPVLAKMSEKVMNQEHNLSSVTGSGILWEVTETEENFPLREPAFKRSLHLKLSSRNTFKLDSYERNTWIIF